MNEEKVLKFSLKVNLISDLSQCPLVSRKYIIAEYLSYHSKEERNKQKAKKNSKILILQICQNKIVWLSFSMFFVRNSGCYR